MKFQPKKQKGFIILVAVIFLAAIGSVVSSSIILLGLNSSLNNSVVKNSFQASLLSDSCQEYTMLQIKDNSDYVGDEIINTNFGTCNILPVTKNNNTFTIYTTAEHADTYSKIKALINKDEESGLITIESYQQLADF
jgi:hypothetical protein